MMIAALMVATLSASAQNEVGQLTLQPKVGINISNITGSWAGKKSKVGVVAGFEAEYGISEIFALDFGVLYSMEGFKQKDAAIIHDLTFDPTSHSAYLGDVNLNLDYINIPILAQIYPAKGFAVKAGIQPAFNVRHKSSGDYSATIDGIKSFNFSIPVGLSYEYECFVLDARYNIGVTKIFKNSDEGRNSTFSITLGYKFPL